MLLTRPQLGDRQAVIHPDSHGHRALWGGREVWYGPVDHCFNALQREMRTQRRWAEVYELTPQGGLLLLDYAGRPIRAWA